MHGDLVLVVLVLVVGFGAFLFGLLYAGYTMLAAVGRALASLFRGGPAVGVRPGGGRALQCPRPKCRHIEYRAARFCCRCGAELLGGDVR